MRKVTIIKMSGKAQSGKDYSTEYLTEILNRDSNVPYIYSYAFAHPVKQIANNYLNSMGIPIDKSDPRVRVLYQSIGDTARKVLGENVWIYWMQKSITNLLNNLPDDDEEEDDVIIFMTDCRYENEVFFPFHNKDYEIDALLIRITAPVKLEEGMEEHPSETGLDHLSIDELHHLSYQSKMDYIHIDNSGTLEELHRALDNIDICGRIEAIKQE